jgi:hypothetical protein
LELQLDEVAENPAALGVAMKRVEDGSERNMGHGGRALALLVLRKELIEARCSAR